MTTLFGGASAARDTLQYIEERGGIGLWTWDLTTNEMAWSRGFYSLLRLEPGDVRPSYDVVSDLIHPEDRLDAEKVDRIMRGARPIAREFRLVRPDGEIRWIANRGEVLSENGQPTRAVGALFDITREFEGDTRKDATERRFEAAVNVLGAATWIAPADGSGGDEAFQAWVEQSFGFPIGGGWLDASTPSGREAGSAAWRAALSARTVFDHDALIVSRDGQERWIRLRAAPILGAGEVLQGWTWTCTDVDASKRIQRLSGPTLYSPGPCGARSGRREGS